MAFNFEVRHHGTHDKLGLATMLQAFADEEWVAEHMTGDQAAFSVMDRFTRIVKSELELIEVIAKPAVDLDTNKA